MQTGTNFSESFTTVYEDDLSFLEKTVNDYPVSSLALFLLLQKYKQTGNEHYDQLFQKAAVYFPNHTWLNYQLSGDESMNYIPEEVMAEEEEDEKDEDEDNDETYREKENLVEAIFIEPETDTENKPELPEEATLDKSVEEEAIREMEKEEMVEFVRGEKADNFEKTYVENESNEKEEINTETLSEENPQDENKEEAFLEIENKEPANLTEEKILEESPEEISEESENTLKPKETNVAEHTESVETDVSTVEETTIQPSPPSDEEQVKTEQNQSLEFEPLHTIDYFASQGIIIREEALMNDKLGKQMKSFTDWLKSMKKLHPGKLPEQNEVVEKIIQSSAELSNEDAGVLTEAMADVLIKQGKRGKAIEMFEKLSLMNPSKSIYFAAKIESLKK